MQLQPQPQQPNDEQISLLCCPTEQQHTRTEDVDTNALEHKIHQLHNILNKNWSCPQCKQLYKKRKMNIIREQKCVKCVLNYNTHIQFACKIKQHFTTLSELQL